MTAYFVFGMNWKEGDYREDEQAQKKFLEKWKRTIVNDKSNLMRIQESLLEATAIIPDSIIKEAKTVCDENDSLLTIFKDDFDRITFKSLGFKVGSENIFVRFVADIRYDPTVSLQGWFEFDSKNLRFLHTVLSYKTEQYLSMKLENVKIPDRDLQEWAQEILDKLNQSPSIPMVPR